MLALLFGNNQQVYMACVPGEHTLAPSATAQRPRSVPEWEGRCAPDRLTQQVWIQPNVQTGSAEAC
jgi:hypothetical protein